MATQLLHSCQSFESHPIQAVTFTETRQNTLHLVCVWYKLQICFHNFWLYSIFFVVLFLAPLLGPAFVLVGPKPQQVQACLCHCFASTHIRVSMVKLQLYIKAQVSQLYIHATYCIATTSIGVDTCTYTCVHILVYIHAVMCCVCVRSYMYVYRA